MPISRESRIARRDVVGPALGHALAREVHDRVAPAQRRGRRGLVEGAPGVRLDVAEGGARPVGIAREHRDGVAARLQRAHDPGPDEAGGAGEGDVHRWGTPSWPGAVKARSSVERIRSASIAAKPMVSPATVAAPCSLACSATAAATAGETSRLKTDGTM